MMMAMLRWFVVPSVVLVIAVCLASARWFDDRWVIAGYSAIALPTLILWRRATYRLEPSLREMDWGNLDDRRKRRLNIQFAIIFGMSLSISIGALLCLILVPAVRTESGVFMVFVVVVWSSIIKFGALHVLAHYVLQRPSFNSKTNVQ